MLPLLRLEGGAGRGGKCSLGERDSMKKTLNDKNSVLFWRKTRGLALPEHKWKPKNVKKELENREGSHCRGCCYPEKHEHDQET